MDEWMGGWVEAQSDLSPSISEYSLSLEEVWKAASSGPIVTILCTGKCSAYTVASFVFKTVKTASYFDLYENLLH